MSTDSSNGTLPTGWKKATIADVAYVVGGRTPTKFEQRLADSKLPNRDIPFYKVGDMNSALRYLSESRVYFAESETTDFGIEILKVGTVVFPKAGGAIATNKKRILKLPGAIDLNCMGVTANGVLHEKLLYWFFESFNLSSIADGTVLPQISKKRVSALEIAFPMDKDEQTKLVEILEEQLSRLDAALASVRAVREKAARFRRSLLHAAFTGALTGHDTSTGTLPPGWSGGSLGEFCEMYQPKTISTKELIENGEFPVYGANGQIGFYDKYNHNDSEVTVTCRGATCGTVNVIPGKSWITGNAMVVRPIDNCMSKPLLSFQLQSLDFTRVITGTAQPQITRTTLTEIEIILPSPVEQEKIIEILEEQLSRLDASLAVVDEIEFRTAALRRSLLHAAFTGNLTKEWRENSHV
jgi:restriction endonuclease S subunit